ncbi:MAG TPA: SAM-dependent methyltransferase, partial [Acidimicrobiales bacterium]|nr:SAM-dependent methyltransferase [Acidimicrobiales bacterium]
AVLPKLSPGGLLAADNTLWSGRVVEPDDAADAGDENTKAIKAFNDHVAGDGRVVCVQLTVRDGVTLIRKRD